MYLLDLLQGLDRSITNCHIIDRYVKEAPQVLVIVCRYAAALGILRIIGVGNTLVLTITALLAIGFTTLVTGLALSGRAFKFL